MLESNPSAVRATGMSRDVFRGIPVPFAVGASEYVAVAVRPVSAGTVSAGGRHAKKLSLWFEKRVPGLKQGREGNCKQFAVTANLLLFAFIFLRAIFNLPVSFAGFTGLLPVVPQKLSNNRLSTLDLQSFSPFHSVTNE
jgi:hypothetical protein